MKQEDTTNAIETVQLGKRYRSLWALKDCSITVPKGSISALVGPNGAGKTTLLALLVGLNTASAGKSTVLGMTPTQSADYIAEIGYLAQDIPLYTQLTVNEHIQLGKYINRRWDEDFAYRRLQELAVPLNRPVKTLSGGQRAQVGLALALAKRPRLLLLDEPVAALDPLAREDFLQSLADAVADADGSLTVLMSSHLIGDLERICDHLIILAAGKTQLCTNMEDLLARHKVLVGPHQEMKMVNSAYTVIQETHTPRQTTLLVRLTGPEFHDAHWQMHEPSLEEITLAYMRGARQRTNQSNTQGGA